MNISAGQNAGFQMKTHPNIDKALYSSQSVLGLKDPHKPFPAGSPLGILKWRMQVLSAACMQLPQQEPNSVGSRAAGCPEFLQASLCGSAVHETMKSQDCLSLHGPVILCAVEF